ncbi:MAG: hypothetical protein J0M10_14135 [Chitinophagales bacterium]|jgi:hypothetical protein|nr:hypothetical protein [Chitinophagales bacterium]
MKTKKSLPPSGAAAIALDSGKKETVRKNALLKCTGLLLVLFLHFSCGKDTDNNNNSRVVTYELTGNYTGTKFASYTTSTGGTANETITTLPWTKEITYNSNLTAASIAVSGNGGTSGQQVKVVIKKGGTIISTTIATADNTGSFTRSALVMF